MARLTFRGFAGMIPKIAAINLAQNQAVEARNCRLDSGTLRPWRGLGASVATLSKAGEIKTIYRFGAVPNQPTSGFWFHWNQRVHAVRSPVLGDTEERTYFTGTDRPRYTYAGLATSGGGTGYPTVSRPLGVPIPANGPLVAVTGTPDVDADPLTDTENRSYVVTYVTLKGEEGPPSLPSLSVDWLPGQVVELTGLPGAVAGEWDLTHKRIYRRASSSAGDEYFLVGTVAIAVTTFTDNIDVVGAAISSYQYYEPPSDLHGLGVMPAGFMYGFSKNQVCFSEIYLPHAWDPDIRLPTNHPIVGGGNFGDTIVAITTKNPYVAVGQDPRSMAIDELQINQGCVSAESIVSTRYGVIYGSPDGAFMIGPAGAQNLLENYLRPDQWQQYNPASIRGAFFDDRYFAFYDTGTEQGALILKPSDGAAGLVKLSIYATAAFADPLQDKLFLVQDHAVQPFDSGSAMTMTWTSGEQFTSKAESFSVVQVVAPSYTSTSIRIRVDGTWGSSIPVTSPKPIRFFVKGNRFQVEITSQSEIESVVVASQPSELGG